jgi:hypothetical protein
VRCDHWSILLTEGEYCITLFPRVVGWGLASSHTYLLVICGLTGRDSWFAKSSWRGEGWADVVIVGLGRGRGVGGMAWSGSVPALSSGACRLMSSFISCSWGCLCCICRCWSSWFFRSLLHLRDTAPWGPCCLRGLSPMGGRPRL